MIEKNKPLGKITTEFFSPEDRQKLKYFYTFPYEMYKNNMNYIPDFKAELLGNKMIQVPGVLEKKHPIHKRLEVDYLLVRENDQIKAIGALFLNLNALHDEKGNKQAFFGFIHFVEDFRIFKIFFDEAKKWAEKKSIKKLLGPFNFTQERTLGILIEGYEVPASIMSSYNFSYYPDFFNKYGFEKNKDLFGGKFSFKNFLSRPNAQRYKRIYEKRFNESIRFENINFNNPEVKESLKNLYNDIWKENWLVNPITEEEVDLMIYNLKTIYDKKLSFFIYYKDELVGFTVILPDVNTITWGKSFLHSFDLFRLLKFFFYKKNIRQYRFWSIGVKNKYRNLGIPYIVFYHVYLILKESYDVDNIVFDMNWIYEGNTNTYNILKSFNAYDERTWRIYELDI